MDLVEALGVTRQQALFGTGVGLVVALLLAANFVLRRGREDNEAGLGLHHRR